MAEERVDHPPGIVRKSIAALLRGIAVADQEQVDLVGWGTMFLEGDERLRRRSGALDEHTVRIDDRLPYGLEGLCRVAPLHCDANGRCRTRKAQRFVKAAMRIPGLVRGRPLAEDRGVSARVEQASARLAHLEAVCAGVAVVDCTRRAPRPRQRLEHDAVDREHLEAATAGVHQIDAQGRRRCDGRRGRMRLRGEAEQACEHRNRAEHVSAPCAGPVASPQPCAATRHARIARRASVSPHRPGGAA